jgi:hypothetical protein
MILKAAASAIYPNTILQDNLDNIILAATTTLSGTLLYFGLAEYNFTESILGALIA